MTYERVFATGVAKAFRTILGMQTAAKGDSYVRTKEKANDSAA